MNDKTKLKSCPFCGAEGDQAWQHSHHTNNVVECGECGATGPKLKVLDGPNEIEYPTISQAQEWYMKMWNERHEESVNLFKIVKLG